MLTQLLFRAYLIISMNMIFTFFQAYLNKMSIEKVTSYKKIRFFWEQLRITIYNLNGFTREYNIFLASNCNI